MRFAGHHFERNAFVRVLRIWAVLTVCIGALVLTDVQPGMVSDFSTVSGVYRYFIGPGLLVLAGGYAAVRAPFPWSLIAGLGTLSLLVGAGVWHVGCGVPHCLYSQDYQHLNHVRLAFEGGPLGPGVFVTAGPSGCNPFQCGYPLTLVPLLLGYGSLAGGLLAERIADAATAATCEGG